MLSSLSKNLPLDENKDPLIQEQIQKAKQFEEKRKQDELRKNIQIGVALGLTLVSYGYFCHYAAVDSEQDHTISNDKNYVDTSEFDHLIQESHPEFMRMKESPFY